MTPVPPARHLLRAKDLIDARYFEELKSRGVEFSEEPSKRPYGIDAAFRDPSGNQVRVAQST